MIKGKVKPLTKPDKKGLSFALTKEQQEWLIANRNEKRTELARALGIDRKQVRRLLERFAPIIPTEEPEESAPKKQKNASAAKKNGKSRKKEEEQEEDAASIEKLMEQSLLERMSKAVKRKDGTPFILDGEMMDAKAMADVALIQMAKDNPQANIMLRAQVMRQEAEAEELERRKKDRKAVSRIKAKVQGKRLNMQNALGKNGLYTELIAQTLAIYTDALFAYRMAQYHWEEAGAPSVDVQITAQAQRNERPSQLYQIVQQTHKVFMEATQKLRTDIVAYYKLISGDQEETSNLDEFLKQMATDM